MRECKDDNEGPMKGRSIAVFFHMKKLPTTRRLICLISYILSYSGVFIVLYITYITQKARINPSRHA